ncbi:hypothetical protein ACFQY7_50220 [Actinomadura luteofluorescens]|uniref:Uncharacterized protein n=1 Tax=Actinomadura luteofluorescens TaxID=46163 RepID=A0A7Y9EFE2_9ACTN|nr:hypothetical protein [Actinomadura luteofluorescens]NYD46617.1 hypothetical protein [Actinomadura luteofluorescens]
MASSRRRAEEEQRRLAETQRACGNKAEDYILLALRTSNPVVEAGAWQAAKVSNRQAGQTLVESLNDPRNKVTPEMRVAREALRDGA